MKYFISLRTEDCRELIIRKSAITHIAGYGDEGCHVYIFNGEKTETWSVRQTADEIESLIEESEV